MGKNKGTEKNSKKYRSQIKNDIRKKTAEKAKKIQQMYRNSGGGSRVVRRTRADVNTAPAIYGERIRKGGKGGSYNQYYPYQEGVLDKQMALSNYYDKALRQHQSKNQWNTMIAGLSAGKFEDLDKNRRDILAQQYIEEQQRVQLETIKNLEKQTEKKRNVNKAAMRELGISDDADEAEIVARNEDAKRKKEKAEEVNKNLKELSKNLHGIQQAEHEFRGVSRDMRQQFGNHPKLRRIDTFEDLNPAVVQELSDEIKQDLAEVKPALRTYMSIQGKLNELITAHERLSKIEAEFEASGRNHPHLAGILVKGKQIYGGPQERLIEIDKAVKEKQQFYKKWLDKEFPKIKNAYEQLKNASDYYMETRNDYRNKSIKLLLETDMIAQTYRQILEHNPDSMTDVDLQNLMKRVAPYFGQPNIELQERMKFYHDTLDKFGNPEVMKAFGWGKYLAPLQELVEVFDFYKANKDKSIEVNQKEMDERMLNIARKLLHNHHLGEKVQYGPKLEIEESGRSVEVPLDQYGYQTTRTNIKLELSDTNAPIKTGYEPKLAITDGGLNVEKPGEVKLEPSGVFGVDYSAWNGLQEETTLAVNDLDRWDNWEVESPSFADDGEDGYYTGENGKQVRWRSHIQNTRMYQPYGTSPEETEYYKRQAEELDKRLRAKGWTDEDFAAREKRAANQVRLRDLGIDTGPDPPKPKPKRPPPIKTEKKERGWINSVRDAARQLMNFSVMDK